jgi:1-acyl-sn-glycerol-3-phosphate acyltransferase
MSRYPYPVFHLIVPALRVLLGLSSSIRHAAALMVHGIRPAPRVLSANNIPAETPFVLVMNHYDRPGLGAWWGALVVLNAIANQRTHEPRDVRMLMTREWWYPGGLGRALKQPITRWFFEHLAKSYGLVLLPPVTGHRAFRGEGIIGIRRALALTRADPPQLVGLAPEGRTGEQGALCKPPRGAGLFLAALSQGEIPFLPAGIFEDDEPILTVQFGEPFRLCVDRTLPRELQDVQAACEAMVHIGRVLPERMWGVYSREITKELEGPDDHPALVSQSLHGG